MNTDINIDKNSSGIDYEEQLIKYYSAIHERNKKRIKAGMICMIIIPMFFMILMFAMNSSKIIYLVLWIVSLFALCVYLIAVEYMDYNLKEHIKDIGIDEHKLDEIIGPDVIKQDIDDVKERIGL
ncbi:MAG: hypothetical protein MR675_06945 [Lachnospira sp.]|nr:hypothetical protein [Lachnospira sp.]MDD5829599.1 hypothetical protein [Lachnospira sp.]